MLGRGATLLLAFLVVVPRAAAQEEDDEPPRLPVLGETSFSLTSTTVTQYRGDNHDGNDYNDDFLSFTEKLDLTLQGEELGLFLRLDGFVPLLDSDCPSGLEDFCVLDWDARPERFGARWDGGDLTVELGDSYAVFGRGLALSFRKVDLLGIDTTLRGAQIRYDGGRFSAQVLAGMANIQNLDPVTLEVNRDPADFIAGARVAARIGEDDDLVLGFHTVRVWFEEDSSLDLDVTASVYGWSVQVPALVDGRLSLYGEANALYRDTTGLIDQTFVGRGVYASAQLQLDQLSLLIEWKDYRDFLLAPSNGPDAWRIYSAAPSLDLDTERFRGIHNSRGGSLLASYAFAETPWSLSVGSIVYGHEDEDRTRDPWNGILVTHGYVTLRRDNDAIEEDQVGWSVDVTGGYRHETYLHDPFDPGRNKGDPDWQVAHGQVELVLAYREHALDLLVDHRYERRRLFETVDYVRGGLSLTWTYSGVLAVSAILRWDTEKEGMAGIPSYYPGGEVKWEFRPGSHLRVFGGRTPGGRICSGGVCRDVPAFEGALGELVLRL